MRRPSLARSMRLAMLVLTLALTAVTALGVAGLYGSRQRYEDRLANAYALEARAGGLLAAGVVEEATLRTAGGRPAARLRARARQAFDATAAAAARLAHGDRPSEQFVAETVAAQQSLRRSGASPGSGLRARTMLTALSARQTVRREQARLRSRDESRRALVGVLAGGILALLAVLAFVAALLSSVRRPLDDLVRAARRLSAGDMDVRVAVAGPPELRVLARTFNTMSADLAAAVGRLEAERRQLAVVIESLGDGLVIVGADGRVRTANPRAAHLAPELAPGVVTAEAEPPLPPLRDALAGEVTVERPPRTLAVTASRLEGQDDSVVWTLRDVTDRVRLERLKTEFVATASHELRSPLTSIKGFIELLAQGQGLSERQREFVDIVSVSTNRLVDLVNDLLDVARVEAGQAEIHRRPIDLTEVVREVGALMGPRLAQSGQLLELDLPESLPLALADPSRVRQIVTNLLTNAHLYTDAGGRLSISIRAEHRRLALTVSDTGRGMTEEQVARVFERFYRGPDGASTPGSGLGLAIVKSLVDLHGGTIHVASRPGHGSSFTVELPQAVVPADSGAARHALRGKRVLVVDDEPDIARLISARLAHYDVRCVVATDGAEGVRLLREQEFDAMTLDILMPGMSGFEVLRAMRADPALARTPVVVVSVFSGREALSGEWVVSKPIDSEELADALGAAVLAGRVRLLAVGRPQARQHLEQTLNRLGIEHEWATSEEGAARLCTQRHFEVALVDAGLARPHAVLDALNLRGRRLRRSVVVFSMGETAPGFARLDAEPVPIDDAGAAVLALLETDTDAG